MVGIIAQNPHCIYGNIVFLFGVFRNGSTLDSRLGFGRALLNEHYQGTLWQAVAEVSQE